VRRGCEDPEVTFDFPLGADGVEQTGDGVLPRWSESGTKKTFLEYTHPVRLSDTLNVSPSWSETLRFCAE